MSAALNKKSNSSANLLKPDAHTQLAPLNQLVKTHEVLIAPSLLSADFSHLAQEVESVSTASALHFDVMDGHFVPNLSFGIPVLKAIKTQTQLPLDVHLMVTNPEEQVPWYLEAGADIVTFHIEAATHAARLCELIHSAGALAGVSLNPATSINVLEDVLSYVDLVLVMSVNPGFGGQSYLTATTAKIKRLVALCQKLKVNPLIEVDGGIGTQNAAEVVAAGARMLVAGSAIFGKENRSDAIQELTQAAVCGLTVEA